MNEKILNNKKRKNMNDLKSENEKKYKLIIDYENQIKKIKKEIKENTKIIQKDCEHDLERIIEPHERTYYICRKCQYDTRYCMRI